MWAGAAGRLKTHFRQRHAGGEGVLGAVWAGVAGGRRQLAPRNVEGGWVWGGGGVGGGRGRKLFQGPLCMPSCPAPPTPPQARRPRPHRPTPAAPAHPLPHPNPAPPRFSAAPSTPAAPLYENLPRTGLSSNPKTHHKLHPEQKHASSRCEVPQGQVRLQASLLPRTCFSGGRHWSSH